MKIQEKLCAIQGRGQMHCCFFPFWDNGKQLRKLPAICWVEVRPQAQQTLPCIAHASRIDVHS